MIRPASLFLSAFLLLAASTPANADVVRGRVLDPDQRPVAQATVLIVRGNTVIATATTDADGKYGPITVPAGDYDVLVSAPRLQAPAKRVTVAATGSVDADIAMTLAAVNEAVVVSAAQVDQPLSRVTDSVTVIDRSDLVARQTETGTDALRLVPGFSLASNGGRGGATSIFARGGESDYTLVLFDGIPLNVFGGGFDAAHLSIAGIDRLEVVRGPQSAVYGSGAIGGVVNVITRKGGPPRADFLAEMGGQGTSRVMASTNGGHQAWSWGASFERLQSDGDTSFRSSIAGHVSNDDYERFAGAASLGWSDRATRQFRIASQFGRDERGNPGPYGSDPFGFYSGLDTVSRSENRPRGIAASAMIGDARSIRHTALFGWSDTPSFFASPFGDSEDRTRRVSGRYQADLERRNAGFSAGLEVVREQADNTFVTGELFQPIPVVRTIAGIFVESRWQLGTRGSITAGVRGERIDRSAMEGNPSFFGPRPAFDADVIWSTNPKISAVWFLRGNMADSSNGWTKVRAGAGTGIKPPTVFELAFTDNPSLKPEHSRSVDAGIEHAFPGATLVADLTFFDNRYDDLIVSVGTGFSGASVYRTDNIANARARGAELGVRWQSAFGLSVRGAYTWLDTEVLGVDDFPAFAAAPYAVGDRLIRRPKYSGSLDIRYACGRMQLFLTVNGRGETADFEPNFASVVLSNPGFVAYAAGGSIRVTNSLEAYARVTNLANRAYEDVLGYPAQARSASVGLRVAIGR